VCARFKTVEQHSVMNVYLSQWLKVRGSGRQ
jgi:hypothetical protein